MNTTTQHRLLALVLILAAVCVRLLPGTLIPNFAPITAVAVFSAFAFRQSALRFVIPFVSMILSDAALAVMTNNTMYLDPSQVVVYAAFMMIVLLSGIVFNRSTSGISRVSATLLSSVFFFIVTNFAVWAMGTMYPMTIAGFIECYTMAIPFFRNSLLADSIYAALIFGCYELAVRFTREPEVSKA